MYGDWASPGPDDTITVEAGKSVSVKTERTSLDYIVGTADGLYLLSSFPGPETVEVKQQCGTPTSSPTTSSSSSSTATPSASTGSTSTQPGSSTTLASTKPGSSSSTKSSGGGWTASPTTPATGPAIVTDGPQPEPSGSNSKLIAGAAATFVLMMAGVWFLGRRLSEG